MPAALSGILSTSTTFLQTLRSMSGRVTAPPTSPALEAVRDGDLPAEPALRPAPSSTALALASRVRLRAAP